MVFVKILVLVLSIFVATLMVKYREKLVRMVGKNEMAERYLGNGGSYLFWIIFAIFLVFLAASWIVGFPWTGR